MCAIFLQNTHKNVYVEWTEIKAPSEYPSNVLRVFQESFEIYYSKFLKKDVKPMLNKNQLAHESVRNVCTSANIRKMLPLAATGATPGSIKLKLGYDHNSVVQLGNQTMAQVILFRHNLGEGELIS